jgi:hypothetical protein
MQCNTWSKQPNADELHGIKKSAELRNRVHLQYIADWLHIQECRCSRQEIAAKCCRGRHDVREGPAAGDRVIAETNRILESRIGHWVPIWQPYAGSSCQRCERMPSLLHQVLGVEFEED